MNIRDKDLNLLSILVGIAEEQNLSRGSVRLGLSQPALSHALSRLREQFGDALFVRGQRGLVPTPKVGALLPKVRAVLALAESLYGPCETLNLAKIDRNVVIASTAYFESHAIVDFIRQVQKLAPRLQIETITLSGGFPKNELESGDMDVAIAAYFEQVPDNFRIKVILSDRFVCVCSKRNAYLRTRQTTADYLNGSHMQIEVPRAVFAHVDQYLRTKTKVRNISLRIGNFLTPPAILEHGDWLLTCPLSLAERYRDTHALTITELPFWLPAIETKMVWHEKNQRDPFHNWLRDQLAKAGKTERSLP
jgi:DNA-binding transcriptional LysR family regulator